MNDVPLELRVNGRVFDGFVAGDVQLSMQYAANEGRLEYCVDADSQNLRAIFTGDEVELALDGDVILSGYVVTCDDSDEADMIRTTVTFSSRTIDLTQCSAITPPTHWMNATVEQITRDLCLPFEIEVNVEGDVGEPFESFSVKTSETVIDAIQRACAKRGLIPYTVGGGLVLAAAGSTSTKTVLERGINLRSMQRVSSDYNRFSAYRYHGSSASTDSNWGKNARYNASVDDSGVRRYRPLLVEVETGSGVSIEKQAQLEANRRAGQSDVLTATVDGWFTEEGTAWRPNLLLHAKNPVLGIDADVLVQTVRFSFGANVAQETLLTLVRLETYSTGKFPIESSQQAWES